MFRIKCPVCKKQIRLTVTSPPAKRGDGRLYERRREYWCPDDGTWVLVDLPQAVLGLAKIEREIARSERRAQSQNREK